MVKYTRKIEIQTEGNTDQRNFDVAISSETPVIQLDRKTGQLFQEVLSHEPGAMSIRGGKDSVKLRWNHDENTLMGDARSIRIDPVNRNARAVVRFGNRPEAEGLRKDVIDGIATDISVGYHYANKNVTVDRSTTPETRTVHNWVLDEVSPTPDGADSTVGFGRSAKDVEEDDDDVAPVDMQNQAQPEEAATGIPESNEPASEQEAEVMEVAVNATEAEEELRSANISDPATEIASTTTDISTSVEDTQQRSLTTNPIEEHNMPEEIVVTQPAPTTNFRSADLKDYSVTKMIRGLMQGGLTGLEKEVAQEIRSESTIPTQVFVNEYVNSQKRAFALNGAAGDGKEFNVPLFGGYLDLLLPETLFGKLNCPTMNLAQPVTLPGGDVPVPTSGTETGISASESDPTSRNILFSPLVAVSQIGLTRIMLESGTPGTDAYLVQLMRKRHASTFEDLAFARILAQITQSFDYGTSTADSNCATDAGMGLLDLIQVVANQIDEPATSAFVCNHALYNKLSTVKRSANLTVPVATNNQIWDRAAVKSARVKSITGKLDDGTTNATFNPIIWGAWEYCQLASFGSGVNIIVDQITKALQDQVLITAQAHWDAEVTQPVSFAKCVNVL